MDKGVFSESQPDLSQGCIVLLSQQFLIYADDTRLYISDQPHVHACEVILVEVRGWGAVGGVAQRSGSDSAWKTSDKRQPEHSRSIGQSGGPNYKLIAPKHVYQPAQKKLMYDCSGATASEVLMHLSLKPYLRLTVC